MDTNKDHLTPNTTSSSNTWLTHCRGCATPPGSHTFSNPTLTSDKPPHSPPAGGHITALFGVFAPGLCGCRKADISGLYCLAWSLHSVHPTTPIFTGNLDSKAESGKHFPQRSGLDSERGRQTVSLVRPSCLLSPFLCLSVCLSLSLFLSPPFMTWNIIALEATIN